VRPLPGVQRLEKAQESLGEAVFSPAFIAGQAQGVAVDPGAVAVVDHTQGGLVEGSCAVQQFLLAWIAHGSLLRRESGLRVTGNTIVL